jgi:hypothetical protein
MIFKTKSDATWDWPFFLGKPPSGISLDSTPALRQNFTSRSIRAVSQILHQQTQPNKNSIARFFLQLDW